MIRSLLTFYSWRIPTILVYMLQNTEYQAGPYLRWFWETNHFERVMYRRTLDRTGAARLLLLALRAGIVFEILIGLAIIWLWSQGQLTGGLYIGAAFLLAYPVVWAHVAVVPLILGRIFIVNPRQRRAIRASRKRFADFRGIKIAVAGSYGKTTMKELLSTVLSEGKKVAATPANQNVSISHAIFAKKLRGDEDILVIEYGEGAPGDVQRFADITKPTHAVITGVAPAHLDKYKTLTAAGKDIFSLSKAVAPERVYINGQSPDALQFVQSGQQLYSDKHVLGWDITVTDIDIAGTRFTMRKGKDKMELKSGLVGRYQVGPLALVAALAREFGLSVKQIQAGVAKTKPFEHRMEPYQLGGAWVIDDSYNGNIEGIRCGLQLLKTLSARRKIYVTPGLVDQGRESPAIHQTMGRLIADAKPDMVVLMQHSVTADIQKGLKAGNYQGELLIETDPLNFYQNLTLFVANGDLVMLQNDWPDNYR